MMMDYKNEMTSEKEVLDYIIQYATSSIHPQKIILFGSRARGDAKERSDYDIAFDAPNMKEDDWNRLCVDIVDQLPTLLNVDLIWLSQCKRKEFLDAIAKDGVIIYEKRIA